MFQSNSVHSVGSQHTLYTFSALCRFPTHTLHTFTAFCRFPTHTVHIQCILSLPDTHCTHSVHSVGSRHTLYTFSAFCRFPTHTVHIQCTLSVPDTLYTFSAFCRFPTHTVHIQALLLHPIRKQRSLVKCFVVHYCCRHGAQCSIVGVQAVGSSKILLRVYQTTRRHISHVRKADAPYLSR